METFRPFLIRLLAVLFFVQSGVALAHCLRGMAPTGATLIEICSAEGMRSIRLDEGDTRGEAGGFCPICQALPEVTVPVPPGVSSPAWLPGATVWHAAGMPRLAPPTRAAPYEGRGPPAG